MRIGVLQAAGCHEVPGGAERFHDRLVGVAVLAVGQQYLTAGKQRHVVVIGAVFAHRVRHLDAMLHAEDVVILAVAGGDMHEARALFVSDEITRQKQHKQTHQTLDGQTDGNSFSDLYSLCLNAGSIYRRLYSRQLCCCKYSIE